MSNEIPNEGDQPQTSRSASQSQTQSSQSSSQLTQSPSRTQSPSTQSQSQAGSSSSSGPTSASQSSSSSGTLSSLETIPVSLPSVPEEPEPQPWGRLLPMGRGFRPHDCIEEEYVFGRDSSCHYVIDGVKNILIYSKKHFRIYREGTIVYVEDYSNNGTFVDGMKIGKGKMLPLVNSAVLSLSDERNRVFVFIDLMTDDQTSFPREFQEKYVVTRRIGTGVCGEVRLAFERSTCKNFAVKIINKNNFQSEGTACRNAEREIQILQKIDHPCLIKTEDFYQTDDCYYIILELMEGGELFQKVKSQKQLSESVTKLYFYQMLTAVQYLHRNGIIHRDLKPENILLASQEDICLIKVTDFNQSRVLEESALMRTLCGTPSYLAPEVFTHALTTGYGIAVDAWSLGVLLFVCLGGYPPFHESEGHLSIRDQIIQGKFTMLPNRWIQVTDQAKDMVRRLLVVDPSKRMTIEEALQHPWLQDPVMLDQAQRVMYPPTAADAPRCGRTVKFFDLCNQHQLFKTRHTPSRDSSDEDGSNTVETCQQEVSRRKRSREEEDEHPAKRSRAPPSAKQ